MPNQVPFVYNPPAAGYYPQPEAHYQQPANQTTTKSGFDWGYVGGVVGTGFNFLSSCEGNCWTTHPPFSGRASQRQMCLESCRRAAVPQPPPGALQSGGGLLLPALAIGALIYFLK